MGKYVIADNKIELRIAGDVESWKLIEPRFRPFAGDRAGQPDLTVDVHAGELPASEGDVIYSPGNDGAGFLTGRTLRTEDGSLIMEFKHKAEGKRRVWMKMPPLLNEAEIIIREGDAARDHYFLTHALMMAFMLATCGTGTLLFHASSILYDGKAYLFQGKSGTGKSTHAALWVECIAGAELLNDDNPVVRFNADGTAMAYGSPWSGKTDCYRNLSAPVGAIVRIVRAKENELRRLQGLQAYASLTASVFFLPFLSEELRARRHQTLERLAMDVRVCEMHCRPDAEAAMVCREGLIGAKGDLSGLSVIKPD